MDILARIKRLILSGRIRFTSKAETEVAADHLTEELICEAIINAPTIFKKLRSKNPQTGQHETLYVIIGLTFDGLAIYTKGKIATIDQQEYFYVLISSKRSKD